MRIIMAVLFFTRRPLPVLLLNYLYWVGPTCAFLNAVKTCKTVYSCIQSPGSESLISPFYVIGSCRSVAAVGPN